MCLCVKPVGDDVLEADEDLSFHVQFVDGGVDSISTGFITMESVSVSNDKEDSAANLEHFPVSGTECLGFKKKEMLGNYFILIGSIFLYFWPYSNCYKKWMMYGQNDKNK